MRYLSKILSFFSDLQCIIRERPAESLWVLTELDMKMDTVLVGGLKQTITLGGWGGEVY